MVRHRLVLLIISMAMVSGWVTLSGSSIYQATETVTPSFTPTMPWCEYTPTKRYQDVIPVFEFGATSTIDPLATMTNTPEPTATIEPSITPTGTWYGLSSSIEESRTLTKDNYTVFNQISSTTVCGANSRIAGIVFDVGKNWDQGHINFYENVNGTGWSAGYQRPLTRNTFFGGNNEPIKTLVANYLGTTNYYHNYWNADNYDKFQFRFYNYDSSITAIQKIVVCKQYNGYVIVTPEVTSTPMMTVTPNCRPYEDTMADADPFAEFDYNYIGNTCISLFDGIQLSLDDLPNVLLDAMDFLDTTGIFDISLVPELNVPGLEICLDQYQPIITLMDVDLVSPLSIMITLVVIGGLINEFRS